MKVYRDWLQDYFEGELPQSGALADALTFHTFEIESVEDDVLDVKVTPNRGHDCLCHRGIAKELSAILNVPMKTDPLRAPVELAPSDAVSIEIKAQDLCRRYIAGYIRGVKVGPSPAWLSKRLEAIGQRSINNVVDATNYVMFDLGQPLHAFDAGKLSDREGKYAIAVRTAKDKERIIALDGKEYELEASMLAIVDGHTDMPIGIAGVKGGAPAAISKETENIIIESANFDGASVRKAAQKLRLRTDASSRFEQVLSPELPAWGMWAAAELVVQIAGGEVVGFVDMYPRPAEKKSVSMSLGKLNRVLGTRWDATRIGSAFDRLSFAYEAEGDDFTVFAPFERLDLGIEEDLIEEVARLVGYDEIPALELPAPAREPKVNASFHAAERMREELVSKGYSEVVTSVFAEKGDRLVANKVDGVRPYLRSTLVEGLTEAREKNSRNKDLLGLANVRLFEIGTIWRKGNEQMMLGTADEEGVFEEPLESGRAPAAHEHLPIPSAAHYRPFSKYPFVVRDIALWIPKGVESAEVLEIIREHAGDLLVRSGLFDEFEKGDRISYAFRLVFQSFDKTLTDFDVNERMGSVAKALSARGWEVR